ncbi:hypothetical protein [Ferrimonas marina]|uniref:Uncharacterized protein n=1 Tax=Ferrimonas marina TaxID=299255 RepID=A0A1M5UFS0_9GAMM|nr:hypothetical protein [Ferrimonas marina]SHH61895.1 hypothetical protein SAMN02745129_2552 [Ferrimonas marina]
MKKYEPLLRMVQNCIFMLRQQSRKEHFPDCVTAAYTSSLLNRVANEVVEHLPEKTSSDPRWVDLINDACRVQKEHGLREMALLRLEHDLAEAADYIARSNSRADLPALLKQFCGEWSPNVISLLTDVIHDMETVLPVQIRYAKRALAETNHTILNCQHKVEHSNSTANSPYSPVHKHHDTFCIPLKEDQFESGSKLKITTSHWEYPEGGLRARRNGYNPDNPAPSTSPFPYDEASWPGLVVRPMSAKAVYVSANGVETELINHEIPVENAQVDDLALVEFARQIQKGRAQSVPADLLAEVAMRRTNMAALTPDAVSRFTAEQISSNAREPQPTIKGIYA